jgi:AraC-like DNA-binding protein
MDFQQGGSGKRPSSMPQRLTSPAKNSILRRPGAVAVGPSPYPRAGAIRVGPLTPLPEMLQSFGLDPQAVAEDAGLSLALLDNGDNVIPYAAVDRLLARCVERTLCAHFGLLLGERGGLHTLGPLGLLIQHAPDLRTALGELVRYLHIHDRGAVTNLVVDGNAALLSYSIYERGISAADQIADTAVAVGFNILKSLCGPEWQPLEVLLPRSSPADLTAYRRLFQAPIRFNSEQAALVFSVDWLDRALPSANVDLHKFIEDQLQTQLNDSRLPLAEEVRRVVRTQLMLERVSVDKISTLFGMSRRTLSRRLKSEGTSFNYILNEVRFEVAGQLLSETEIPLAQIAAALDYAEPSAFTHAFRRWSGSSPAEWRRDKRNGRSP